MKKFIDELVLGLFGLLTWVVNATNDGPTDVTVVGIMMLVCAAIWLIMDLYPGLFTNKEECSCCCECKKEEEKVVEEKPVAKKTSTKKTSTKKATTSKKKTK